MDQPYLGGIPKSRILKPCLLLFILHFAVRSYSTKSLLCVDHRVSYSIAYRNPTVTLVTVAPSLKAPLILYCPVCTLIDLHALSLCLSGERVCEKERVPDQKAGRPGPKEGSTNPRPPRIRLHAIRRAFPQDNPTSNFTVLCPGPEGHSFFIAPYTYSPLFASLQPDRFIPV